MFFKCFLESLERKNYVSNIYAWKICVWPYYYLCLLLICEGQAYGQMDWPLPHWREWEPLLRRTYYWSHTLRFLLLTNILTHFKKTLYIYLFIYIFSANSEQQFNFSNVSIIHCKLNTLSSWKYNLNHSIHLLFF